MRPGPDSHFDDDDTLDVSVPAVVNSLTTKHFESSNYRVCYFRIVNKSALSDGTDTADSRETGGLILEVGLLPKDAQVSEASKDCFRVPAGLKVVKMKAGDIWPFPVPNSCSVNLWDLDKGW
jgi:hypothetical protein